MSVHSVQASSHAHLRVDIGRLVLAMLALSLLAAGGLFAVIRATGPSDGTRIEGGGTPFSADGVAVGVRPDSTGTRTLSSDDRVQAVSETTMETWVAGLLDPGLARPVAAIGDQVSYQVVRDGSSTRLGVALGPADLVEPLAAEWGVLAFALAMQLVGLALFVRRPDEPAARALLVIGTGMFASSIPWAIGLQPLDLVGATTFWLYAATAGLAYSLFWCGALHFAMVFPRPMPFATSRTRVLTLAYAIPLGAQLALIVGALLVAGRAMAGLEAWMLGQLIVPPVVIAACLGLLGYSYWRLVDPLGRQQLRWIALAIVVIGAGSLLLWFGPQAIRGEPILPRGTVALLGLAFPVALVIAISQHHLFRLEGLVRRSAIYGGLTVGILATYAGTVVVVSALIPGDVPFAATLLGAGAAALVALPLRDRLQATVDRALYGDRSDPYRAVRRLGERLEATMDPRTILPTLVEQVAESLRLPYVAIELEGEGEILARAETGSRPAPTDESGASSADTALVRLAIAYHGERIGWLSVAPRGAGERFSEADERLLTDLVRQVAPAAESVRLTADLRRSRELLVAAREEERRRLRRELHDGLGPTLVASHMKLQAARALADRDPDRAAQLLVELETEARRSIDEVRRMAYDLRPPTLDDLGLVGALRQHATSLSEASDPRLDVHVEAPETTVTLPAAVEVAGFRIALEGLTNVARHSGACHARVRLAVDERDLVVEVADDGAGLPIDVRPGIGLTSMRERAEELGGHLDLLRPLDGGTRVVAHLPLGTATA